MCAPILECILKLKICAINRNDVLCTIKGLALTAKVQYCMGILLTACFNVFSARVERRCSCDVVRRTVRCAMVSNHLNNEKCRFFANLQFQ